MKRQLNNLQALSIPALLTLLLLTGCVRRELEYREGIEPGPGQGNVDIALHWEQKQHPQSCRYLIYDEAGDLVKEVSGISDSYRDVLTAGRYRLVVHNTDATHVDYQNTHRYESAKVFAVEVTDAGSIINPGKSKSKSTTTTILEPQSVYGTGCCRESELFEVVAGETRTATVTPKLLTREVKFIFKIVNGNSLQSLTGTLDGVSRGVFLATGKYDFTSSCTTPFEGKLKENSSDYLVNLTIFNLMTRADSPEDTNDIHVSLVEKDGTKHDASFDLTEVIQDIIKENGGEIPIEIPIEITLQLTEFGLTSTVGRWEPGAGSGGEVD